MSRIFQKAFHCFPKVFHCFPKSFPSSPRIFVIFTYMAKFIIEYEYKVGEQVEFTVCGKRMEGIVQDVSQMPDVYVERWEDGK